MPQDPMPDAATERVTAWLERRQVGLYLAAIVTGLLVGLLLPGAHELDLAVDPAIALLLCATFLAVPLTALGAALRDLRFLGAVVVLNFVVVPVVVLGLTRFVADQRALLVGVLLVLLAPCVDYVMVFAGLAGAAHERLLAASPLLMLLQLLLLPVYLVLFVGGGVGDLIDPGPFVRAFVLLIALPLGFAAVVQRLARTRRAGRVVMTGMSAAMVPLMMLTLAVVVASQADAVGDRLTEVARVIPVYVAFLVLMAPIGVVASRVAGLDVPASRALVFSGATRNSLVVLPLALALPADLALAPLVVVTQTLVELFGMVVYVHVVPRLLPSR